MNESHYTRFPFGQVIWGEEIEGDQGCERIHDPFDYEDDCCFSVTKVSLHPVDLSLIIDECSSFFAGSTLNFDIARGTRLGSIYTMAVWSQCAWYNADGR